MLGRGAGKREQLTKTWSKYYARPLVQLIAVVAEPFDDDANLAESTIEARRAARRQVRELFAPEKKLPSGGQIEAPLLEVARRLLDVLREDEAASVAVERLTSVISTLGDMGPSVPRVVSEELEVPGVVREMDGDVPFGMWR